MKRSDCRARRGDAGVRLAGPELERHLFVCPACRARVRIEAAWRALKALRPESAPPEPAAERFVTRVLETLRSDLARRRRRRLALAAAAALLFFLLVGTAERARVAEQQGTEEAYASLAAPSALEGLLPE